MNTGCNSLPYDKICKECGKEFATYFYSEEQCAKCYEKTEEFKAIQKQIEDTPEIKIDLKTPKNIPDLFLQLQELKKERDDLGEKITNLQYEITRIILTEGKELYCKAYGMGYIWTDPKTGNSYKCDITPGIGRKKFDDKEWENIW